MAVYKRGNVYWCDFSYAGKRYQESTKTSRKTLAVEYEKRRRRELEETYTSGRVAVQPSPGVPELWQAQPQIGTQRPDGGDLGVECRRQLARLIGSQIGESPVEVFKTLEARCRALGEAERSEIAGDAVRALARRKGTAYLIQCQGTRYVKIGSTAQGNALDRLRVAELYCPLDLIVLAEFPGGERLEKLLHILFAPWFYRREWFLIEGAVAQFLEALKRPETEGSQMVGSGFLGNPGAGDVKGCPAVPPGRFQPLG